MDIVCYERDQGFVLRHFREGEFDYIDAANEVVETDFFRFIQAGGYLRDLAKTYPSPRKKEEVPTWFYIASNLTMRIHGAHSFHAYPYVVRCGGMLNAFGPNVAHKNTHPDTGDVTLRCEGFNEKNDYERQTPCDQDFLRKFSKDTSSVALETWFNTDVVRLLKRHKVFDPEGIFIGDGSYVFVPDNDKYEHSARLLFDPAGHPVSSAELEKMTPEAAAHHEWKRCYKLVSLLYVDRSCNFALRIAMRLLPGNASECPVLYDLIDGFVAAAGTGVIKRLLVDRGFLDGAKIAHCKREHGIDTVIPLRKNMDLYQDVLGLLQLPDVTFAPYQPPKREPLDGPRLPEAPPKVQKRERKRQKTIAAKKEEEPPPPPEKTLVRSEVAAIEGLRSWSSCSVPLNVVVNREVYADGHEKIWMLVDTKPFDDEHVPARTRDDYILRTQIEEGHRQLKCFWDLASFTSRAFSLVLNQIVFVTLAYNLLQLFLLRQDRAKLNRRSRNRVLDQLLPTDTVIIIYYDNRFATLTTLEYTEILLTLAEPARKKILEKTRRLRKRLTEELRPTRPP